ncbi:MAG TPA: L-threonine 3-dehydrogenase [Acidimicrobiaceae bacterium]|nr:L-threonine 3-dehydrogenase [Acidimicrobiaceae bacterium]HBM55022.1 L-threonine 3-dehydrogenase [Acidimicrobiaceae bacterium]|tara:strand:- start:9 stop:1037 length:1029 start_codon:yes stop_codon:yes gene_type:complete
MRALVKPRPGPGLELVDRPKPIVGPNDVAIAVKRAAICGTDLHIFDWDDWAASEVVTPVTVGHEFFGVVDAVGDQVKSVAVGERVAGEGHVTCGTCRNCRAGRQHLCRNTIGVGIHRNGGFADLVAIPVSNVYRVPDEIQDNAAAVLDPLGNAVHTTLSFDLVGEDVLITGAGPIGQMAAGVARVAGARHVVVTDTVEERRTIALRMGASRAVEPGTESLQAAMSELGMREGFDVGLEMSGHPAALDDMVSVINHGGRIALLGLYGRRPDVDMNTLIFKGLTVKGIYGREMFETWYKATGLLTSGLDVSPVISHVLPLEDFDEAFDLVRTGRASKVIFDLEA